MNIQKIFTVCFLGSLTLVGCGNSDNANSDKVLPETKTIDTSSETKPINKYKSPLPDSAITYLVATEKSYVPFVSLDKYGNTVGLDVDLIRAIGETQGFKVAFNSMNWAEVSPSIASGRYDIGISGIHVVDELTDILDPSNPYLEDKVHIVSLKESGLDSIDKFLGKKIGIQDNTIETPEAFKDSSITIINEDTSFQLFESLMQKEIDAFLLDKSVALAITDLYPEVKLSFVDFGSEPHKISFYTKQNNKELMDKINKGLAEIKENGRYQEINKKWFGNNANTLMVK